MFLLKCVDRSSYSGCYWYTTCRSVAYTSIKADLFLFSGKFDLKYRKDRKSIFLYTVINNFQCNWFVNLTNTQYELVLHQISKSYLIFCRYFIGIKIKHIYINIYMCRISDKEQLFYSLSLFRLLKFSPPSNLASRRSRIGC